MKTRKKRFVSILLALALLCVCLPQLALPVRAEETSGTCGDNLTWDFNEGTGSLTVAGSGTMYDFVFYSPAPWKDYSDSIKEVIVSDGVTSIGEEAFKECFDLERITIPDSVETIGNFAFWHSGLSSVTIPGKVNVIGDYAFEFCQNMSSIIVSPQNQNYSSLDGVLFNKNQTVLLQYPAGKKGPYDTPSTVITINERAFRGCVYLTDVTLSENVESVGNSAFQESSLENITILNRNCQINDDFNTGLTLSWYESVTICGYKGSTAEEYAEQYGFSFTEVGSAEEESKVKSISISDQEIMEGTCGYWNRWNKGTVFFEYDITLNPALKISVEDEKGTVKEYSYDALVEKYGWDAVSFDNIGDWAVGNNNTCSFMLCGISCTFQVNITPSPVSRIEFHEVIAWEGDCVQEELFDENTFEMIEFDKYWELPYSIDVWLKDGSHYSGWPSEILAELFDERYLGDTWAYWSDQTDMNHWGLGDHTATLGFLGKTYPYTVSVIENPIASFEAHDLVYEEYTNGGPGFYEDEDGNVYTDDSWYWYDIYPEYTITFKDGTVISGTEDDIVGITGHLPYPQVDLYQDADHPLSVGTHQGQACYGGKTASYTLTILSRSGFSDVKPGAFYEDPVAWAVKNDITNGTSPTTFSPDATCTRGQVVTFLWRANGSPAPASTDSPFVDVVNTKAPFYYNAVLWAVANQVTSGMDKTHFGPDAGCTRGQVVTFLWRTAGCPEPESSENPFTDVKDGAFYYKAVLWAVEQGITNGMTKTAFAPDTTCTRGQIVTFLYRAMEK